MIDKLLTEFRQIQTEMDFALANMLDSRDVPGAWTERQKDAYEFTRRQLRLHSNANRTLIAQLDTAVRTRATVLPKVERLLAAKVRIETLIAEAPDYQTIVDDRASKAEWARQNGLTASLAAIQRGVEYFNGQPALPQPLRELLTEICPHADCPHGGAEKIQWPGALSLLQEELDRADAVIATAPQKLALLKTEIPPLLKEVVTPQSV